jgi:hypothetical protein
VLQASSVVIVGFDLLVDRRVPDLHSMVVQAMKNDGCGRWGYRYGRLRRRKNKLSHGVSV